MVQIDFLILLSFISLVSFVSFLTFFALSLICLALSSNWFTCSPCFFNSTTITFDKSETWADIFLKSCNFSFLSSISCSLLAFICNFPSSKLWFDLSLFPYESLSSSIKGASLSFFSFSFFFSFNPIFFFFF